MLKTTEIAKEYKGFPCQFSGTYNIDPPTPWNPPIALDVKTVYFQPPVLKEYSRIRSERNWRAGRWNDCQHHSLKFGDVRGGSGYPTGITVPWVLKSYTDIGYYPGTPVPIELVWGGLPFAVFGPLGRHTTGLPSLLKVDGTDDDFIAVPGNLSTLVDSSLRAMLPKVKAELSLVNSLIELKDFKTLPRTLFGLKNFITRLPNVVKRKTKLSSGARLVRGSFSASTPTMSEALGVASDAYLQQQFNILPLLSDISGLTTAIRRTRSRVNDLLVRQGKRQVKHFSVRVPTNLAAQESATLTYGMAYSGSVGTTPVQTGAYRAPSCSFRCVREYIPDEYAEFHAQVEYNFWFTRFQTENAQWLGLLDALGVNLNPSIIWNAIPWTFVVDWVVDVSRWLANRTVLNLEPAVNISRYMWSWKFHRKIRTKIASSSVFSSGSFSPYNYLPDLHETIYQRRNAMPTKSQFLTGSGLSSHELSLGVALAIPRGKRH